MTQPFVISKERRADTLVLKLSGDFDGTCAKQVVDLFGAQNDGPFKILVDTSRLNHPDPLDLILAEWSFPEKDRDG